MNVIAEINNNRSASAALRKNLKLQQHAQKLLFETPSLSRWKSNSFEQEQYTETKSPSNLDEQHQSQQQQNLNKNCFINSHIQSTTSTTSTSSNPQARELDQGNCSDHEEKGKQFETLPLSRLEMKYFESLSKDLLMDPTFNFTNVPRVMSASKCSDTFKDVITSLIHDNLLSYTKYYENYFDKDVSVSEMTSNSDALESFRGSNPMNSVKKGDQFVRSNMRSALRQNKKRGTISKVATFSDSVNIFNETKKSPYFNERYQRPVSMMNFTKYSNRSFNITTPEPNQSQLQQQRLNQSFPKTSVDVKKQRPQSVGAVRDKKLTSKSKGSSSQTRLSDSIFNGYQKKPERTFLNKEDVKKSNDVIEEEEIVVHRNAKEYKDISPLFKIKVYDVNDKKELELAKRDLYQRYDKYDPKVNSTSQRQPGIRPKSSSCNNSISFVNRNKFLPKVIKQI